MTIDTVLDGLRLTVPIWAGAMALGLLVAIPVVLGRRSRRMLPRAAASAWIGVWRGIPPIVWLFLIFFGVNVAPFSRSPALAATMGLGLVSSAYLAEAMRAGIDAVPAGQWEALQALGLPRVRSLRSIVLPQAVPLMVAAGATYSITLVKHTSFASLIGANELLWQSANVVRIGQGGMETFIIAGLIYMGLSIPIAVAARAVERRISYAANL